MIEVMTTDSHRASSTATRATVTELLARIGEGDPERVAALFAERVDWRIAANPAAPWLRPRATRADVAGHFADLAAGVEPSSENEQAVEILVSEGEEAVIMGMLKGRVRATGKRFSSPYALRLTVREGEIVRYHLCEDSLAIAEACTSADG